MEYQEMIDKYPVKQGESYRVRPNGCLRFVKAHVMHVVDGAYDGEKLIVFKWWGKRPRWVQSMVTDHSFAYLLMGAEREGIAQP